MLDASAYVSIVTAQSIALQVVSSLITVISGQYKPTAKVSRLMENLKKGGTLDDPCKAPWAYNPRKR